MTTADDSSLETVSVPLAERGYTITIGSGLAEKVPELLSQVGDFEHLVIITDENVAEQHLDPLVDRLASTELEIDVLVLEPGEGSKSVEVANMCWEQMLELHVDRKAVVLGLGGGVVGDLAGFVAATYMRGLRFVQMPTTLLAQVDSSVGGKVGINLAGGKNMVGAFWQPQAVFIDTTALATMPDREYRSGLAEVVKYGVILDAEFFSWLEANAQALLDRDPAALRYAVRRSCELKAQVVLADEREETGHRAILNYGHTFAHAFETLTGYEELLHGEAVAIGMHYAAWLACRLGRVETRLVMRQQQLLEALGLPIALPLGEDLSAEEIIQVMARDKKTEGGQLRFVLPDRIGRVELLKDVPTETVEQTIRELLLAGQS